MRFSTSVENLDEYSIELKEFGGVDFSTPTLMVAQNRAVQAVNFINRHGTNCKRNGYLQILQINDENDQELQINGIFNFVLNNKAFIIIYAGKRFYRVYDDGEYKVYDNIMSTCSYAPASLQTSRLKDNRTFCFVSKNKAYFIGCGDYLVFGSWDGGQTYELRRVYNNEDTYIPTTTINIDCVDSTSNIAQEALDDINMLSPWRKNGFVGKTTSASYIVDTKKIDANTEVSVVINEGFNNEKHLTNQVFNNETSTYTFGTELFDESTGLKVGDLDFVTGTFTLNEKTTDDESNGNSNIFVTFCLDSEKADYIQNCEFGTYFGTDGNMNRLFLSGNEQFLNCDFYSGEDDFTYFSQGGQTYLGNTPIVGYLRLSDGTLAILKQDSQQETTVFYRSGTFSSDENISGDTIRKSAKFSVFAGAPGIGAVSRFGMQTLAGDSLFLSKDGVFGLELSSNIATTERFAKERSSYIARKLKEFEDLSQAVSIVYDNRYLLFIDNVAFVADARSKSRAKGSMSDTFDYEWYYWDNMPVRVVSEVNNQLWFGTSDGKICVFDNQFSDRTYSSSQTGELTLNLQGNNIVYSSGLNVKNDMPIKMTTKNVYSELMHNLDVVQILNGVIKTTDSVIARLYEGLTVYVDKLQGECGINTNKAYKICNLDRVNRTFSLSAGGVVVDCNGNFRLCELITDATLYITNLNESSQTFQLSKILGGQAITFTQYDGTTITDLRMYFYNVKNVCAEWYSPYIDCGAPDRIKVMKQFTIVTEPSTNSKLYFGYATKSSSDVFLAKGAGDFSFNDVDFRDFTFENSFAASFTERTHDWFNFIVFKFVSNNDRDCMINSLKLVYTMKNKIRGVK